MTAIDIRNAALNNAENSTRDVSHHAIGSALQPLTERQLRLLHIVEQWVETRGWPPSLAELCVAYGASSKAVIVEHLKGLERKGYLLRAAGERRGLQVLVPSSEARVVEPRPIKSATLCTRCRCEVSVTAGVRR